MAVSSLQLHDCSYPLTRARTHPSWHGNLLAILYDEGLAAALLSGSGTLSGVLCCAMLLRACHSVRVCREGIPWDDSLDDSRTFDDSQDKDSLSHSLVEWLAEEVDDSSVEILNQTVR